MARIEPALHPYRTSVFAGRLAGLRLSPQIWLYLSIACTLVPHAPYLPGWLSGMTAALMLWQLSRLRRIDPADLITRNAANRWLILLLAIATGIAVKFHFGHFFGKDPGIALLAVLLCLKQLEVKSRRDVRAAILLAFFLQLGLFLNDQTMAVAALALLGLFLATVTLLALEDTQARATEQVRVGGVMLVQAVPFLVLFFIAFPRIEGPLWGMPSDAFSGTTGLSDSMSPGSISNLIESSAIAFRADFSGPPPPPGQRYWRGPVLSLFDGRTWRALPGGNRAQPAYTASGTRYDYTLTVEPHNKRWLLALDYPSPELQGVQFGDDLQLLATTPVRNRKRIELSAFPEAQVGLNEAEIRLDANLRFPSATNPRTQELVERLISGQTTAQQKVDRILAHFLSEPFIYTLQPPRIEVNTVDGFLFDTQRGFCEHFASAFVFMARAAGVPARVVTGYLGGEINPVDGVMVIRQSDAHAWAEVWFEQRGWVRIDPTAAANPLRIDAGIAGALPEGEVLPFMMRPAFEWLRQWRHQWDAISNMWDGWILGFNQDRQRDLFERLGFTSADWKTYLGVLAPLLGVLLLSLFAWAFIRQRRMDPLDGCWARLCAALAQKGVPRLPWEGPRDYAERVATALPHLGTEVREIAHRYALLRYGSDVPAAAGQIKQLNQRIKLLRQK